MIAYFQDIDFLKIVLWVLIVLLAGFIGQFGKSFAKHLIEKTMAKISGSGVGVKSLHKDVGPAVQPRANMPEIFNALQQRRPLAPPQATSQDETKLKKKELKAALKQKKKDNTFG